MSSAAYYFLPWARQGVLAGLSAPDTLGGGGPTRAGIPVKLRLTGRTSGSSAGTVTNEITMPLQLYGPGDVIGIDPREIVRTEPRHLTTDFPSHLLAAIEFDRPDFPWLFTPASPNGVRLRPWIVLVVVENGKATLTAEPNSPLPMLTCPISELPDLKESWLWAHVQFVGGANEANLPAAMAAAPAQTVSRLLCPRRLQPSGGTHSGYLACLTAAFDVGRKAGLGQPISAEDEKNLAYAWDVATQSGNVELPVYYSWEFNTAATEGDFEELVDKLQMPGASAAPKAAVMDLSQADRDLPPLPGARLGLLSALRPPGVIIPDWPSSLSTSFETFQQKVQQILETAPAAGRRVPPPVYGSRQAGTGSGATSSALGPNRPAWLLALNRNPRYRVAAALGAQVVQQQQEQLVASAWRQAGELADANRWLLQKQLAREVSRSVFEKRLKVLTPGSFQQITAPVAAPSAPPPAGARLTRAALAAEPSEPPAPADPLLDASLRGRLGPVPAHRPPAEPARPPADPGGRGRPTRPAHPGDARPAADPRRRRHDPGRPAGHARSVTDRNGNPPHRAAGESLTARLTAATAASTELLARLDPNVTYTLEAQARLQTSGGRGPRARRRTAGAAATDADRFPSRCTSRCAICSQRHAPARAGRVPDNTIIAARDQPRLHRGLHGRAQRRAGPRAALARVPDRPARHLLPPVLGRAQPARPGADRPSASGCATSRRSREWQTPARARTCLPDRGRDLLFLLIKGDLLVRFPTALIYAAPARWTQSSGATAVAPAVRRRLADSAVVAVDPTPGVRLLGFAIQAAAATAVGWANRAAGARLVLRHPGAPDRTALRPRHQPLDRAHDLARARLAGRRLARRQRLHLRSPSTTTRCRR